MREKWHSFIEWCKDIGGLIKENRNITIAIVVFVALVVAAVIISTTLGEKAPSAEAVAVAETSSVSETEEATTMAIPDEPLQEDAFAEVNELVKKYYHFFINNYFFLINSIIYFFLFLLSINSFICFGNICYSYVV